MRIKILIILLLCIPAVFAASSNNYVWNNFLDPTINTMSSWCPFGGCGNLDGGAQQGLFGYTIKRWEVEVCAMDVSTSLEQYDNQNNYVNQDSLQQGVYADTATISVSRELFTFNESLYTISWYLQPKNDPIKYQVFLKDVDDEVYEYPESTADPIQGEAGYDAFYASRNFTIAYIKNLDSKEIILQVKVVDVTKPRIR
ncbi:MAG: hypothetical protein WC916_02060 [Candidatus Woesearchaeota archaeon]